MNKTQLIVSILLFTLSFLVFKVFELRRDFLAEVQAGFAQPAIANPEILTERDIAGLPLPIQRYLRHTGAVGREKVYNFRLVGEGEFKTGVDKTWVKATAEQYNFIDQPRRVYWMRLSLSGLPVVGLHVYKDATATMRIKLAGLITVGDARGEIMNQSETVTVFNDMCLMAPATLIDPRISWESIDNWTVRGTFNNDGVIVSAILSFNEKGELVNFVSNDRSMTTSGSDYQNVPWSTPVRDYMDFNGIRIASYGEAHWDLPEGDFCYGKIRLKSVEYNLPETR